MDERKNFPLSEPDLPLDELMKRAVESDTQRFTGQGNLLAGLQAMALYIAQAKSEVAAIRPSDIQNHHIPSATDELDAIVGATEDATNKIMDVCDEIGIIATRSAPDMARELTALTTRIFEACNFQDITGQRIAKVVETLKHIDGKVAALIHAFDAGAPDPEPRLQGAMADAAHNLLNGPQLPGQGVDQAAVDQMFAEKP